MKEQVYTRKMTIKQDCCLNARLPTIAASSAATQALRANGVSKE